MSWFVDNATTMSILLGLIAAAMVMLWRSSGQNKYLGYAAGAVVLIGLIWLPALFITTDSKRLQKTVDEMADAVAAGNVDDLFKHIANDFQYEFNNQKLTRKELFELARGVIKQRQVGSINISHFKVEAISRADRTARISFRVHPFDTKGSHLPPFDAEGHFTLDGEQWKLKSIDFFKFNSKEKMGMPGM